MVLYCIVNIIIVVIMVFVCFCDESSQFFNLSAKAKVDGWFCVLLLLLLFAIHLQHIAAVQGCILFPVYIYI